MEESGLDRDLRARLVDYMRARQEGWEMMSAALRSGDRAAFSRAIERFRQADELVRTQSALDSLSEHLDPP